MKVSRISLLSRSERTALDLEFPYQKTVLLAGNGFGKSAILKSFYEALGAKPHKIDKAWRDANVSTLLAFSIDQNSFSALKTGDRFTLFDSQNNIMVSTTHIMAQLAPLIAEMFDFRILLADRKDQIINPPPSYCFAPFYIDQDMSWSKPWSSFNDLNIFPNAQKALAEYHSGLRPNAYYEAKARRDKLKVEKGILSSEKDVVEKALEKLRETMPPLILTMDFDAFQVEVERLTLEAHKLHVSEARYRTDLANANEELRVWTEQLQMLKSSLHELDETFSISVGHSVDVECPMCGQHYINDIVDQFALKTDIDDVLASLQVANDGYTSALSKVTKSRNEISEIVDAMDELDRTLSVRKNYITLRDVIQAEGRQEAQRTFTTRIGSILREMDIKDIEIKSCEREMTEADSRRRKTEILEFFTQRIKAFAQELDVRMPDINAKTLAGINVGRGSEGPRAFACYYYAFLETEFTFGSSIFCPIVVDAPNQQGQDPAHLQALMKFLLTKCPEKAQVIIGAETASTETEADFINVEWKKNQVLRETEFEAVTSRFRPYLEASLTR